MSDRVSPGQGIEALTIKYLANETHCFVQHKFAPVISCRDNSGAFLTAMLESENSVVGEDRQRSDARKRRKHRTRVQDSQRA